MSAPPQVHKASSRGAWFGALCNRLGLHDSALEIGVSSGVFARAFLDAWDGIRYWGVDPWEAYEDEWPTMCWDRTPDLMMACAQLAPHAHRVGLIRAASEGAAMHPWFARYGVQFVYIDGDHSAHGVRTDIHAWWRHIPSGGVLAGHDYTPAMHELRTVVDAFCSSENLTLELVDAPNDARSWWVRKP